MRPPRNPWGHDPSERWNRWSSRPAKPRYGSQGLAVGILLGIALAQLYSAWKWGDGRWEGTALIVFGSISLVACWLVARKKRWGVLLGYLALLAMSGAAMVSLVRDGISTPGFLWLLAAYVGARQLSAFDAARQQAENDALYRELFSGNGEKAPPESDQK